MKYLKHVSKTLEKKTPEKRLKTIANICNILIKHLQRMCETYAHPDKQTCNICLKTQIKHWEQTLVTYVYDYYNIYATSPIYFCNISMKHLQDTSETFE
jgi:hypothetical protein